MALGSLAISGCGDLTSKADLDPEGPPKLLQVFVLDADVGDYVLTYGVHPDLNLCGFDKDKCDTEGGFKCADSGSLDGVSLVGHCVTTDDGTQPIAEAAVILGAAFRLVSKELLDPETVEQFVCACNANCPEGKEFSLKPNCSNCGNNPMTTADETGKCLDANDDGNPDLTTLLPGIATIACGTALTYTTDVGDGFYYPSGNQLPTAILGYGGLGPAIEVNINGAVLPADSECTIKVEAVAKDKDGNGFAASEKPITFHTEPVTHIPSGTGGSVPAKDAKNVAVDIKQIVIAFNTELKATTVTATSVKLNEKGGAAVATVEAPTVSAGTNIVLKLTAALKPNQVYTVSVTTDVTDAYGVKLPAAVSYDFTTKM